MKTKRWTIFAGLFAALLTATVFLVSPAMAQSPENAPAAPRVNLGARVLLRTAAETLEMTPRQLLAELVKEEGRTIANVANEKGVDPNAIVGAVVDKAAVKMSELVAAGKMTQAEADERLENIEKRVAEAINKPLPTKATGRRVRPAVRELLKVAAETLEMTPRQLLAELLKEEGRTIANVANEKGMSPDTVVNAIVDKAAEKMSERVAAGKMTQAEADKRLENIRERVTKAVNSPLPVRNKADRPNNQ